MNEGVDTIVLYNELAYHDVLPVEWHQREHPFSRFELNSLEEANLLLLQACAAIEEHPIRDQGEDPGPLAGEIARLDFKLNLVLQLLAKLVLKDRMPAATTIQFNAHGASWTALGAPPAAGTRGVLRIHLHRVAAAAAGAAGGGELGGRRAGAFQVRRAARRGGRDDSTAGVPAAPARRGRRAQGAPIALSGLRPAALGISLALRGHSWPNCDAVLKASVTSAHPLP